MNLRAGAIGQVLCALSLCALSLGAAACSNDERTVLAHPEVTEGARANLSLALVKQIALPDVGVLNPDEFAGVAPDPARRLVYVGQRAGTLLALSMETGEIVWEEQFPGALSSVPVLADDGALLLLGTDNGDMVALELETRKHRWAYATLGTIRNAPLVVEGVVYMVNSRDQVFALDLRTGAWRWQYEQPYPTEFTVHGHAGLAYAPGQDGDLGGGTIFTGFSNGKVAAIGAATGEPMWIASAAPPAGGDFVDADGTPLVDVAAGEVVVTGQSTGIHGLALADGAQRWVRPMRGAGSVVAGPRGLMVVASSLEGVFALEHGGRVRWRQPTNPGFVQTPLVLGDIAYVAHSVDGLLAYDVESGEFLAQFDPGSGMSGQPVFDPTFERFYALSNRGMLVVFRAAVDGPPG